MRSDDDLAAPSRLAGNAARRQAQAQFARDEGPAVPSSCSRAARSGLPIPATYNGRMRDSALPAHHDGRAALRPRRHRARRTSGCAVPAAVGRRACCSGATCRRRARCACVSRSRRSGPSSSSSARCCRRAATSCRRTSPTSSRSCRTACRRSRPRRCIATLDALLQEAGRRGVRDVRARADRERVGRAGAFRAAARRHARRGEGAATRHRGRDRARPGAAGHRGGRWSSASPPTRGACVRARSSRNSRRRIRDELDLTREAANCSQLRRNFRHSPLLLVPRGVLGLHDAGSARDGAHGRHPDRPRRRARARGHRLEAAVARRASRSSSRRCSATATSTPTCIRATSSSRPIRRNHGKYIALDFGIMGTLSEKDKSYLAQNFLAFFRRDYHRVATAHIESGWVPADTRVDELEAEIRVVLEPIFDRPLKEISLGKVLVSLFRASRRFNVRDPAAAHAAAEDAARRRGTGPPARPRPRPVGDREAVPRALDARPDRPAGAAAAAARRGALHRRGAARAAAAAAPEAAGAAARVGHRAAWRSPHAQRTRNRWLAVVAVLLVIVAVLLLRRTV